MSHENGPVQSVAKALRLLDLLMEAHQPLTLAALSEQTGWPKSAIHGLLSTMRESAVVDQQSDGRYCLGVRLFEYGCAVGASWSVSDLAKPHLQHLASVTGQSVFLSLLNRSEVITIEQMQSRVGLRASCRRSGRVCRCTAPRRARCFYPRWPTTRRSASCRAAHWSPIRPRPSSRGRSSSV